jgi:CheY-like chemotaxis protein
MKLLVVEDNPANMAYIMFMLNKLNVEVLKAASGEEALTLIEKVQIKGGLLDIHLGDGMSGVTLMEKIRKIEGYAELPLIAVTAFYAGEMSKELIKNGFDDYLAKPYKFDQLLEILKRNNLYTDD